MLKRLAEDTPNVVDTVADQLPPGFPREIAEPVFSGLSQKADQILDALAQGNLYAHAGHKGLPWLRN